MPTRNITLDYFKLILIIPIISTHMITWSEASYPQWLVSGLFTRIAVSCFFIINGYFMAMVVSNKAKMKKTFIKLLTIYIIWTLIYSLYSIAYVEYKKEIVLNVLFGYYHLWYLAALIPATAMLYWFRDVKYSRMLILCLALFIIGFTIQKMDIFGNIIVGKSIQLNIYLSRNFLFFGFPFLYLGYFFKKTNFVDRINLTRTKLTLLTIVSIALIVAESMYFYYKKLNGIHFIGDDLYLSQLIAGPLLILLILRKGTYKEYDGYVSDLASAAYFVHLLVLIYFGLLDVKPISALFISVFWTLLASVGVVELNKRVKIFL